MQPIKVASSYAISPNVSKVSKLPEAEEWQKHSSPRKILFHLEWGNELECSIVLNLMLFKVVGYIMRPIDKGRFDLPDFFPTPAPHRSCILIQGWKLNYISTLFLMLKSVLLPDEEGEKREGKHLHLATQDARSELALSPSALPGSPGMIQLAQVIEKMYLSPTRTHMRCIMYYEPLCSPFVVRASILSVASCSATSILAQL